MSKNKNKYCIYCGYSLSCEDLKCPKCHKKVNSHDNIFFHYLKEKIKDELQGETEDTFFSILTNFIKSHLYGNVLTLSITFTIIGSNLILNNQDNYIEYVYEKPTVYSDNEEVKDSKEMFLDFASLYFDALENHDATLLNSYLLKDKIKELEYTPSYELTNNINLYYARPGTLLNTKDTPAYCDYHDNEISTMKEAYQNSNKEFHGNDLLYINIRDRLTNLGYSTFSCNYRFDYCMEEEYCDINDFSAKLTISVKILFVNYNNKIYVAEELVERNDAIINDSMHGHDYINEFYKTGGDALELGRKMARDEFKN